MRNKEDNGVDDRPTETARALPEAAFLGTLDNFMTSTSVPCVRDSVHEM